MFPASQVDSLPLNHLGSSDIYEFNAIIVKKKFWFLKTSFKDYIKEQMSENNQEISWKEVIGR